MFQSVTNPIYIRHQAHHNHSPHAYQKATHNAEYYTACKKMDYTVKNGVLVHMFKNNIPGVQTRLSW